jgi:penicillin amidase
VSTSFPPFRLSRLPALAHVAVFAATLWLGARGAGPLPPLGPLLDPWNGLWAVAATANVPRRAIAAIPGLDSSVSVRFDDHGVPHIFAATETDATRALGYVVARDRLFQLELQARAGAGTLTELAGAAALPLDREARSLGMPRAAERKLAALDTSSADWHLLTAYADGVNAWVDHLDQRHLPFEYRLLQRRPMRWRPIDAIHLFNRMGWTLALSRDELVQRDARRLVGKAAAEALYPVNAPMQEPIQPNGQRAMRFDRSRVPPPGEPDTTTLIAMDPGPLASTAAAVRARHGRAPADRHDGVGSNNWAVAPRRTLAGHAILAGDPHLDLTVPSIWYQAHLVVPGRLDVYGVTIPGAPGIVIGFNRDVSWSFTNTQSDVVDYYVEQVDDSLKPTRYLLDGTWQPLELRTEVYRGPRGDSVAVDTLRFTHRGGMQLSGGRWISVRWAVLESPFTASDLSAAARATSVQQWQEAMSDWGGPAQNMIVADRNGAIAIRSTGRFPIRPGDGLGNQLRDGTSSRNDWTGYWSVAKYPQAVSPAQGYLASANQQPIDPKVSAAYLGADWYAPWRAMRINQLLRADSAMTPDKMRRMQTDLGSPRAEMFVPALLAAAGTRPADSVLQHAAAILTRWDRRYTRENREAILFEYAMGELNDRLWDELRPGGQAGRREGGRESLPMPGLMVVGELLADPGNEWWDDRRTEVVEHRDDILAESLKAAYLQAENHFGPPDGPGWLWSNRRKVRIRHLLGLPGFGAPEVPAMGGPSTISPSSGGGGFGSSWRMVVEMGATVKAMGVYPGGQSGNPASPRYLDLLPRWAAGELDTLRTPAAPESLSASLTSATLDLEPAR